MGKIDVNTELNRLRGLIDDYWSIAYLEGTQGRAHDTEDGQAQKCRHLIEIALKRIEEGCKK